MVFDYCKITEIDAKSLTFQYFSAILLNHSLFESIFSNFLVIILEEMKNRGHTLVPTVIFQVGNDCYNVFYP